MDVIVGTAGHIDHGKTALVKALTGTDADRLPEEKRRGITVDIGFAEMSVGDTHFGFVDVPGHERFVRNMLAGASGIDIVMLVIAADDGVMPQTREHFDICRLLGVRSGLIAITKSDLVDRETLEIAKLDVADLVAGSFLEDAPVVAVSSVTGEGIEALRETLAAVAVQRPASVLTTRLPIDRSFSMKGFGTVVTGTLASGSITEGDEVELLPAGRCLRVRGLQSHGRSMSQVNAGQRVAVNLAGIDHHDVTRGMMLATPGVLRPTTVLDARVEVLADAKRPLRSRQRVRLHIGTAQTLARIKVLNASGEISPGTNAFLQITLEAPVVALPGERFILRTYSPQTTIAGGEIIDNSPLRRQQRDMSAVAERLTRSANTQQPDERLMLLVEASGKRGISVSDLQARTGYNSETLESSRERLVRSERVIEGDGIAISSAEFLELSLAALSAIDVFHKRDPLSRGMPRERLREAVFRGSSDSIFQAVIGRLAQNGSIIADGELVRSASFRTDLSPEEQKASDAMRSAILAAGLEVPRIEEVLTEVSGIPGQKARRLLALLVEGGEIVKVTDEFYFGTQPIDELVARMRSLADAAADRSIDVARFKELAGVSRKYAIPLLEYFDREKVTVRRGDTRMIL